MTSISVYDCVRNSSEQLTNHVGFVALWNGIKCLLDDMTTERIHAQGYDIAMDGVSDSNDLIGRAMLEASLDEEVAKTIDHERVGLVNDGFDDFKLLFGSSNLQLLLQED